MPRAHRSFPLAAALLVLAACRGDAPPQGTELPGPAPPSPAGPAVFAERAEELGLRFVHDHGGNGEFYLPEIMGAGGALFDFDGDGDLDAYLVQGRELGKRPDAKHRDRLFRNDLAGAGEGLGFTDVTEESGIAAGGFGMGVAAGDYDNDGHVDLYVTNFGANQLLRNDGDGTFTDVTVAAGAEDERWSTSAAFFDYDNDGWLDLYVANYVDFRVTRNIVCTGTTGTRDYCSPTAYDGQPDRLLHNRGDGTFEDVSEAAGIGGESSNGLGVVTADLDSDGWIDIYVANDQRPNFLWANLGDGTFENRALLSGTAVNMEGRSEASMGVDVGDIDNDGDDDLFMTHIDGETNTLYLNQGDAIFDDFSDKVRLGPSSLTFTGFGTGLVDYDNDGWLDVLAANGAVYAIEELARKNDPFPYHETNQLFRNEADGTFSEVTARAGPAFLLSEASRGAAFGDVDNDGDVDAMISNAGGSVRLLINEIGNESHWIGLRLVGREAPRDMLGARVDVILPGGESRWRRVRTDSSYLAANDPRVVVGLGDRTEIERVLVTWPGGRTETWKGLPVDRYVTLTEGGGDTP